MRCASTPLMSGQQNSASTSGAQDDVGGHRPAPALGELAVGEERNRQRHEQNQPEPPGRKEDRNPSKWQPVPATTVRADRIETEIGAEDGCEGECEQDPADRVARDPSSEHHADECERCDRHEDPDSAVVQLMRESRQRHADDRRAQPRNSEHQCCARGRRPDPATAGFRTQSRVRGRCDRLNRSESVTGGRVGAGRQPLRASSSASRFVR
jgi:hypothetical protein